METQENTVPTIAQLWDRFQKLLAWEVEEGDTVIVSDGNGGVWDEDAANNRKESIVATRVRLLEETKPYFTISGSNAHAGKALNDYTHLWVIPPFRLREIAAAANFMAWELEQRELEKEAKSVNV